MNQLVSDIRNILDAYLAKGAVGTGVGVAVASISGVAVAVGVGVGRAIIMRWAGTGTSVTAPVAGSTERTATA